MWTYEECTPLEDRDDITGYSIDMGLPCTSQSKVVLEGFLSDDSSRDTCDELP